MKNEISIFIYNNINIISCVITLLLILMRIFIKSYQESKVEPIPDPPCKIKTPDFIKKHEIGTIKLTLDNKTYFVMKHDKYLGRETREFIKCDVSDSYIRWIDDLGYVRGIVEFNYVFRKRSEN